MRTKIQYAVVDWNKSNREIASSLGITSSAVQVARRKLFPIARAAEDEALTSLGEDFKFYYDAFKAGALREVVAADLPRVRRTFPNCADEFLTNGSLEIHLRQVLATRRKKLAKTLTAVS